MPTYRLVHPETGKVDDYLVSISEMKAMVEQGWVQVFVPNPNSIIAGRTTSGQGGGQFTSQGWKDVLGEIKRKNPGSSIDV